MGITRRLELLDKINERDEASALLEFDVHSIILSKDAPNLEREPHQKFVRMQMNKVNARKELVNISLKEMNGHVEAVGTEAKWTITAEAIEDKEGHRNRLRIKKQLD